MIPGTVGFEDPSWSPDGRKIAAAGDDAPDWSPDGSRIVFAGRTAAAS